MLNFPTKALALSLDIFLKNVRQSPGQALKIPIQLRWGGCLGGEVQSIQVVATWARLEGSGRIIRIPSNFFSQEKTRVRFASTLHGMAALYFAEQIDCGGEPYNRYSALREVKPRIDAMQSGKFNDTLRGQAAALCCFIGAKNEFLRTLYSKAVPGAVRENTDFQILLQRILKDLSVRDDALTDGQLDYLSGLIYQLFLNSDEHGSFDESGERFTTGMRGLVVRVATFANLKSLIDYAGDDTALKTYLLKLPFQDTKKNLITKNDGKLSLGSIRLLELSVFDTGPGMGLRWLSEKEGHRSYAEISHEEELAAVHTCFEKHATTKANLLKGQGLHQALIALSRLKAFMTLRTGRLSLYQDFSRSDTTDFKPKDRFSKLKRMPEIVGTSYSICFRLK